MSGLPSGGRVAVVGGGPAGLTAAKHLIEHGLDPVVLEQSADIGGQWNSGAAHSGVWQGMRTNTSKTLTSFSDFPAPESFPMFPRAEQIHEYLRAYADRFGVTAAVRTGCRVLEVDRVDGGWSVRRREDGRERTDVFDGVLVASGRFSRPSYPDVPGLPEFARHGRLVHAFDYRTADEFRGQRVLVYGNSISGLEIASDLAAADSTTVVSACRKARYVLPKVARGVPSDWQWFTQFAALAGQALPYEDLSAGLRQAVLETAGNPADFGAPEPSADILAAGISLSQDYLALVAEGRIAVAPAIVAVDGDVVEFEDGSRAAFDVIVCATGYALDLPYLAPGIRATLGADDTYLDLYQRTLHPDLPGLGFLGQYVLQGPYLPVLELQARWLAALWSGAVEAPDRERMLSGIQQYRAMKPIVAFDVHHALASALAAELGVAPDLLARPELAERLLFGPMVGARYRLDGPGAGPDAEALFVRAVGELGPGAFPPAHDGQIAALQGVAAVLGDPALTEVAARLARERMPLAA